MEVTEDSYERRLAGGEVEVRCIDLLDPLEHPVQLGVDAFADEMGIGFQVGRAVRAFDRG